MILDEIDPKKFPGPAMPRFTVRTAAAASTGINANKLIGGDGPSDVAEQGYSGAGIEESRKGDRVEESVEHGCDHGSAVRGKRKTSRDADVRQTRAGDPDRFFELDPMFQVDHGSSESWYWLMSPGSLIGLRGKRAATAMTMTMTIGNLRSKVPMGTLSDPEIDRTRSPPRLRTSPVQHEHSHMTSMPGV